MGRSHVRPPAQHCATDDALVSQRIADQEALLERLTEQRDKLAQAKR
jgi:hypothetical protein